MAIPHGMLFEDSEGRPCKLVIATMLGVWGTTDCYDRVIYISNAHKNVTDARHTMFHEFLHLEAPRLHEKTVLAHEQVFKGSKCWRRGVHAFAQEYVAVTRRSGFIAGATDLMTRGIRHYLKNKGR